MINQNNFCQFLGRLGGKPDMMYAPNGDPVCKFSIALDMSYKNSDGEKIERTTWTRLTAWGRLAETINELLDKGMKVLFWTTYSNSVTGDGDERRYFHDFRVESFTVMDWNGRGRNQEPQNDDGYDPYLDDDDDDLYDPDTNPW
jgi:single-strand DNA-binding protein